MTRPSITRRRCGQGLAAAVLLAALAGGWSAASAQEAPTTEPPSAEEAPETAGAPAGFGATVSDAARRGPAFPAECGNFGRWVSAQARGIACTAPPGDEVAGS